MKCGHFYLFTTTGFNISSHQTLCSIYALFHEASCFPISGLKRYKMVSQDTRNRSVSNQVLRASGIDAELDRYFAEELSLSSCQENGLSFWINREQSYPLLAPLAEDLVSAPASQAYVERVFSVCGDLCARKRNRAGINLERRVFLKVNHRHYVKLE